jgi:hypothetical protein
MPLMLAIQTDEVEGGYVICLGGRHDAELNGYSKFLSVHVQTYLAQCILIASVSLDHWIDSLSVKIIRSHEEETMLLYVLETSHHPDGIHALEPHITNGDHAEDMLSLFNS